MNLELIKSFRKEVMNDVFTKYHTGLEPLFPVYHHFTGPDLSDPHDHPWPFTSIVLKGGYQEEVYTINPDGSWSSKLVDRLPGTSHRVPSGHIHRIANLFQEECWTLVYAGPVDRTTRFYYFGETVRYRDWTEQQYKELQFAQP